jgi:hypothetical protein
MVTLILLFVLFSAQAVEAELITALFYKGSPEGWVGAGETVLVTPADGFEFFVEPWYAGVINVWVSDFQTNPDFWSARWWSLQLASPYQQVLGVGRYERARRWPFQENFQPGLNFDGNGRGNNVLVGCFEIFELDLAPDGSVAALAVDFIQYDEGIKTWWTIGGVRYQSQIPIPPEPQGPPADCFFPEPSTGNLAVLASLICLPLQRRFRLRLGRRFLSAKS